MRIKKPAPYEIIEQVLWALALFSVMFMVLVMPWVGPDGVLTGPQWLVTSLSGVVIFGFCALCIRLVFSAVGADIDSRVDQELEGFNR